MAGVDARHDGRSIVRPLTAVSEIEWAEDICRCGDNLKPGETQCEYCASFDRHVDRLVADDDLLRQRPCAVCGNPINDVEPNERFCSAYCYGVSRIGEE